MNKLKKLLVITLLFMLIFLANYQVFASNTANIATTMEYSEDFKKWLELSDEEKKTVLMPRMYDVPYSKIEYSNPLYNVKMLRANVNSKYSLKDIIPNNLSIRNQQQTNTCWAFARLSSLETNLALSNYKSGVNLSKVYDFSERHMEYATSRYFLNEEENPTGFNRSVGDGGTRLMADSYLANGYGAVLESEMPFENNENIIDISEIQNKTISSQLYDTVDFPNYQEQTGANRDAIINEVKHHIQNYGSVYAGLHGDSASTSDFSCYNNTTGAKFCNNEDEHPANHAVSIIGWDDDYSVENFDENERPSSNGAWIVRNSWGEKNPIGTMAELKELIFTELKDQCIEKGWDTAEKIPNEIAEAFATEHGWLIEDDVVYEKYGDNGLIYVSYEDANISKEMAGIVKASDTVDYENIYAYDELGPSQLITMNSSSIMLCNIFNKKTNGDEYLNQVQLYVPDTYTCKVYVNPNGTGKSKNELQLVSLKAGETETLNVGYHTLEFAKPIKINANSFAVVIEIQSAASQTPFAMEGKPTIALTNPYSNVKVETGKCFMAVGNNLDNTEWYDLGQLSEAGIGIMLPNGDSTIKAFTTSKLIDESLKNIEITTPPTKTSYFEGENFDKTGMVVTANYNSKKNPSVVLDSSNYSITNGTNLKAGQTSVTITFEDKSVNQTISVEKNSVTELKIKTPPTKTEYKEGQNFDKTGMVIEATFKDGTTKEVTDYTITNGNNLKVDQTEVTISYGEKTVNQTITVIPNPLIEINVTKAPNKTKYVVGQDFDKTGMIITGTYQDNSTQEILDYTIENGTNLTKEQTSITIKYLEKTTTQEIIVEEKAVSGISVNKKPNKLTYIQNKEELDLTGGSITVAYNDETTENIDMTSEQITVTGFDNKNVGKITVTLTYKTKTTVLELEIIEEVKAKNSNLSNAKSDVKQIKAYYFTNNSQDDYTLINVEVNSIERNLTNDKVEYYYYISSNKEEQNINNWIKITEEQNSNDKLQFTIDTRQIADYAKIADENVIYLYVKEVAVKGGDQSVAVSKALSLESDVKVETYVDNAKKENVNSGNTETSKPDDTDNTKDNTTASGKLPQTGVQATIVIAILLTLVIGIIVYHRYRDLSKYVK